MYAHIFTLAVAPVYGTNQLKSWSPVFVQLRLFADISLLNVLAQAIVCAWSFMCQYVAPDCAKLNHHRLSCNVAAELVGADTK